MNLVKRFAFRMNIAGVQSLRSIHNEMQPYEEVKPRCVKNRRYGYKSRYHERGEPTIFVDLDSIVWIQII